MMKKKEEKRNAKAHHRHLTLAYNINLSNTRHGQDSLD